jgi:hypothetical protein
MFAASSGYIARLNSFSPNARRYLLFVFLTILNVGICGVIFNKIEKVGCVNMSF